MAVGDLVLNVTTPLGDGVLRPVALLAEESISAPFVFRVSMVSTQPNIDPVKLIDHPVCVKVLREATGARYFHGIVRLFSGGERSAGGDYAYVAEVVPKLWFATQTVDCRIFHDKTAVEIIEAILAENAVAKDVKVQGAKAKRLYTVQYNESDYDFIVRLMEEEGYFFFFTHAAAAHTMVVTNNNQAFTKIPHADMAITTTDDGISSWRTAQAATTGSVAMHGYNAKQASSLSGTLKTVLKPEGKDKRDVNLWPARTRLPALAEARARIRQEAADAFAHLHEGSSHNHNFVPGGKFTLKGDVLDATHEGDYVIRSVVHHCQDSTLGNAGGGGSYGNRFTAFPAATVWRQPVVTPRPHMAGVHVAIVLGLDGEEIHVSDEGRIRVRFYWDHRAEATAKNTIEVRVMQPWAGNGWGMQHIPRVGTEVAVAFVNGDPDDPIVIGSLYNGKNTHPFPLPAEKTKSGIKTRSTLKGGSADYNEFFFDDKKGSELVSLHAQKDHKVVVENDQATHVMHDQKLQVDNNRVRIVKVDETVTIDGKQTLTVKGNRTAEITQGNESLTVKMGNVSLEAGQGNIATLAKMGNITSKESLGNVTIKADLGKVTVEAMQAIELKVGGSSVKIDQMGVTIKGMMIKIDGQVMTEVKGLMTKIDGSAMTMVKGAITMIG